jgi:2-octaprenyl-6-methoxyphenol hydroxylase
MDNPGRHTIVRAMDSDCDILIAGGGLNGLTLALALGQRRFRVVVIDPQPSEVRAAPGFDGRAYALAAASRRMLAAIGLWDALAPEAQEIRAIKVSDGRAGEGAGPGWLHFDGAEIEDGPMGHMVEDRHLRPALLARLAATPGVTHLPGDRVVAQAAGPAGVTVTLASGRRLRGRLLAGCDGRGSGTAERAGIGRDGWSYGQTAIVCAVDHALPHDGIAHQFFMPSGPLAILPLRGNRSSIVWSETDSRAAALMALPEAAFLAALRPAFGSFLGAIALAGARSAHPLALSLARRLTADRVVLVGDAAHGVHPIAGQGLNAGLRDVAVLVDVLSEARRRGEDIGSAPVLDRHARWRRFDTAMLAAATDLFNRLFSNDHAVLRLGRGAGLAAVSRLPPLRRAFMREAAGLTGDLPSLMR